MAMKNNLEKGVDGFSNPRILGDIKSKHGNVTMEIRTNNQPRDIIYGFDLTEKERQEFDWMDWDSENATAHYNTFFRYKGNVYVTCEAVATNIEGWQGIYSESAFSAVVIRFVNGNEQVVVGQVFS